METKPGNVRGNWGNSDGLPRCYECSFTFLPDDGSNTLTNHTHTHTHRHTPHIAPTSTFRMSSHLLSEKNGERNKRKKKKRQITLEWFMDKRKGWDSENNVHVCWPKHCGIGRRNKKMTKERNQLFPFNYIWRGLIEIPLQVFSAWVPGDNL